jgi:hypothetical protein
VKIGIGSAIVTQKRHSAPSFTQETEWKIWFVFLKFLIAQRHSCNGTVYVRIEVH